MIAQKKLKKGMKRGKGAKKMMRTSQTKMKSIVLPKRKTYQTNQELKMEETKEIVTLKGQVTKLDNQANEIQITTPEENASAMELKAKLKDTGKQIKERKEAITKPINESLKSIRALFAPLEDRFEKADALVGRKLLDYKRKVDEEARAKEAKIAASFEKGNIKAETAERKIEEIQRTEKTVVTDHGKVQFRKIQKVRVVDEKLIPDSYWVIDQVLLRKDVLAGIVVPGAEKYEEEIV